MNRLTLVATIGAVLVAAILGLIYAVSKQDLDDTPETAQVQSGAQPAEQPASPGPTETQPPTASQAPANQPAAPVDQGPAAQSTISGATAPKPIEPAQPSTNNQVAVAPA